MERLSSMTIDPPTYHMLLSTSLPACPISTHTATFRQYYIYSMHISTKLEEGYLVHCDGVGRVITACMEERKSSGRLHGFISLWFRNRRARSALYIVY